MYGELETVPRYLAGRRNKCQLAQGGADDCEYSAFHPLSLKAVGGAFRARKDKYTVNQVL
jgi:hypothetical protein